jgi:hypothetical protein
MDVTRDDGMNEQEYEIHWLFAKLIEDFHVNTIWQL